MSAIPQALDDGMASRFATLALGHVRREFPNKLDHVLAGPADLKSPRALHPVFFGSFDWHSCVHSYWLLATLRRLYPQLPENPAIARLFETAFTKANIAAECAYLKQPAARLFERPYGWAWLLMLQAELMRTAPHSQGLAAKLRPLSAMFVSRFSAWLRKATYPNRVGTHANSAFAVALAFEYAITAGDKSFMKLLASTARGWYARDRDCQAWEPSGEDFISPALVEAECMRRVFGADQFGTWFALFLPRLTEREPPALFRPARVSDRTDGRIVHLDGLNLSRAWCWRALSEDMRVGAPIRAIAARVARRHLSASLPSISGHYMGEHWLASFALLALRPAISTSRL